MPGMIYGWPKNVLHWAGTNKCIYDITATVKPHLATVDGIVSMEGDGPIMGDPVTANVLVMGRNLPRLMLPVTELWESILKKYLI